MTIDSTPEGSWRQLSQLIANNIGLHFPGERQQDLRRGIGDAAGEFGFEDDNEFVRWLISTPLNRLQWRALAGHLTIGETYFFRERRTFDALAIHILPDLFRRRSRERRLRIWSAACCTGEEAYSLAILLHQAWPGLTEWKISILATDINEQFLRKAATGLYGDWSFRDAPMEFRERYFTHAGQRQFSVAPHIRQMVTYAPLNLAEDCFPSLEGDTQAMDLIFCRNVLMYFSQDQAIQVVEKLFRALVSGGYLVVGPSECSQSLFRDFEPVNFPGAILYRKPEVRSLTQRLALPLPPQPAANAGPAEPARTGLPQHPPQLAEPPRQAGRNGTRLDNAMACYRQGQYAEAETELDPVIGQGAASVPELSLMTRTLANQGKIEAALDACNQWIRADMLNANSRYLRGILLRELDDLGEARRSLQEALYLEPRFVLAHFALGNIARGAGNAREADRHFSNALDLLEDRPTNESVPESDGLTAGRLKEIIVSLIALAGAA